MIFLSSILLRIAEVCVSRMDDSMVDSVSSIKAFSLAFSMGFLGTFADTIDISTSLPLTQLPIT